MTDHDKDWLGGKEWQLYVKIKKVYISPAKVPPPQYNIPSLASLLAPVRFSHLIILEVVVTPTILLQPPPHV